MESLFGIPLDILMWTFVVITGAIVLLSIASIVRQPLLFRLSMRNIRRRMGRGILIVTGLMLATTIISAAFGTGDTIAKTIRTEVVTSLGNIDEIVSAREEGDIEVTGESTGLAYFDETKFEAVRAALADNDDVDGVMPLLWELTGVQNMTTRQTEPRVSVFAPDPAYMDGFGTMRDLDGNEVSMAGLGDGEIYLNREAQENLDAEPGHELTVYGPAGAQTMTVKAIVRYHGAGTISTEPGLMMPLDQAQALFQKEGQIEHIVISNRGGEESGAALTDAVIADIRPTLAELDLQIEPTKQEDLGEADEQADAMSSFFVTFGSFSIAAGIMLIFLIFVMLAAERKPEMGISRAVGTERRHLIEMFALEGLAYDIVAAAIGALLGVGVSWAMAAIIGSALSDMGLELRRAITWRSVVTAYVMGVGLTFVVVTISAWRVSVLNIVAAIRNLPEQAKRSGKASIVWGIVFAAFGALLTWAGISAEQTLPFMLGTSLLVLAVIPFLRWLGVADRAAYSLPALVLIVWWLLPADVLEPFLPEMTTDGFNIFVASGLIMVTAATWVVMYNSDAVVKRVSPIVGRFFGLAPTLRTAFAYPLTNRFRTGMTLAMFTLVVFTLVTGTVMTTAFTNAYNDVELYGGGFDLRSEAVRVNPVTDLESQIASSPSLDESDFEAIAEQSLVAIEARQSGTDNEFGAYPLRGVDDEFTSHTTYGFGAIARGYDSAEDVWAALSDNPELAVLDGLPVPRHDNFSFGMPQIDFKVEGFYMEDETFDPFQVEVREPTSGRQTTLTVIGILPDTAPAFMIGLTASQRAVEQAFPDQAQPNAHLISLDDNADAAAVSDALEAQFLEHGMEAVVLQEELDDIVAFNRTFNFVVEGFLGLGLIVGVAALGVISARSVVERRHEIGVMRAIGFERERVQASFLIEACMVAVIGIVAGTGLGIALAFNIIRDVKSQPSWAGLDYSVPWLALGVIFAIVLIAAVVTAYVPARQASRVYPAQALRYQ